jgi:NAD(P)-dependent dehydrogenase (short-subunit alcohol dehydrogenase family)
MERLDGSVVIVSGASRGIGKGLALGLADAGAAVVCAARSSRSHPGELPGTVEDIAEEIGARGGRAVPVRADIGVDADVARMINVAVDEYGRLDVLVNNAMASTRNTFDEMTLEQWDTSWRINVRSLFVTCSAAVKAMAANDRGTSGGTGGGSIINISSGAADALMPPEMLPPGYLAYSVAKAALERFSTALAPEVAGRNIAVNALRPGAVKTEQSVHELGEDYDWSIWKEPSFVVPMVHCLALQRADGLTGRIVDVNSYGTTWGCD